MPGTIKEKLDYLAGTKTAIKQAIEAKGVTVAPEDNFRSYATKIGEITGGGGGGSREYTIEEIVSGYAQGNAVDNDGVLNINFRKHGTPTTFAKDCYRDFYPLKEVRFDSSLGAVTFEPACFAQDKLLTKVSCLNRYPNLVETVQTSAFRDCPKLVSFPFGSMDSLISIHRDIENDAFYECRSLVAPEICTTGTIYTNAFYGCRSLGVKTIKASKIAVNAFPYNCTTASGVLYFEAAENNGEDSLTLERGCLEMSLNQCHFCERHREAQLTLEGCPFSPDSGNPDIYIYTNSVATLTEPGNFGNIHVPYALLEQYQADTNWSQYNIMGDIW